MADGQMPKPPSKLREMNLSPTMLRDLLLKSVFRRNLQTPSEMAKFSCVMPPVIEELIEIARTQNLIETLGNRGAAASAELRYVLTDSGKARALDALGQSEYYGAFPVPLAEFEEQVKKQQISDATIRQDVLEGAMSHLILPEGMLDTLGPAINSGRSILLYGPPGNGKSVISNGIRDALGEKIYIPKFLEIADDVISLYDPMIHQAPEEAAGDPHGLRISGAGTHDPRYVKCKRPSVMTGGELTLDMLDLSFNKISRTYQAPLQLKASGGVFIVDDLGRQKEPPQALINRWIIPMEKKFDILQLVSGQKFTVPFDTLVIFSTNYAPNELFDGAALRRIYYKIKIDRPNQNDFLKIFVMVCRHNKIKPDQEVVTHLIRNLYGRSDRFAAYQAPFLIDQMISIIDYEGLPREMTIPLIERAWENLYIDDEDSAAGAGNREI